MRLFCLQGVNRNGQSKNIVVNSVRRHFRTAIKASDTLEHQPKVWPVPYVCAQPYHPGSGSHGLKGCFAPASAVKGRLHGAFSPIRLPGSYAMLMRPNKAATAVHGCHCPGDMAVRMR